MSDIPKIAEYVVWKCPDGSILLDWNENLWKYGYPAYPKDRCTELERGICEGGLNLPKLAAKMRKKYAGSVDDPMKIDASE